MPNNFRKTGDIYISKDGSDANPIAANPNAPKATLADYGVSTAVVGSGDYKGAFSLANSGAVTRNYIADGLVGIRCTADFLISPSNSVTNINTATDFQDLFFLRLQSFNLSLGICNANFYNTVIESGGLTSSGGSIAFLEGSILRDVSGTLPLKTFTFRKGCIFNGTFSISDLAFGFAITDTYVSASTSFVVPAYFPSPSTDFKNNNFQGSITISGTTYELKRDKAGNAIDPNPSYSDLIALDATVYTRGNFSQDPEFLNLAKGDYWTVSATSPNILADSSGIGAIGNVQPGAVITVLDTELAAGATIVNLAISTGDLTVATTGSGSVESANIQAFPIAQQVARIVFATLMNFNSNEAIGSAENKNVLSVFNYASGTAGANPRRFATYEMMWTADATQPVSDAGYDNNGYFAAGTKAIFEGFKIPKIDINGKGNGEPDFVSAGSVPILGKHFKVKLTLWEGIG